MMLPVDIENDLTVTVLSTHDVTPPVGAPVKGAPCVEAPVEQGNLPGIVGHKMTRMVRHRHKRIVQKGHNVGGFILHVSVPPLNVMTPAQVIGSARKVMFTSRTTKMEGAEFAIGFVMSNCADPCDLPGSASVTCWSNSLYVSLDLDDLLRGVARYLVGVAVRLGVGRALAKPAPASLPVGVSNELAARSKVMERLLGFGANQDFWKNKVLTELLANMSGILLEEGLDADRPPTAVRFTSPVAGVLGVTHDGREVGLIRGPTIVERVERRYSDDLEYFATVEGAEPTIRRRGFGGVPGFEIVDGRDDS
ncbi:MAG: hypothetical protein KF901_24100 [Myxococcales bacterium]|nr:hypothetical protein [Myxococcales bacterium]